MSSHEYHLVSSSVVHYYPHLTDERTETERIKYHGTLHHLASTLHVFCYLCHLPSRLYYTLSLPLGAAIWLVWASGMLANVLQIDGWQCPSEGHISGSPWSQAVCLLCSQWMQWSIQHHSSENSTTSTTVQTHIFQAQISCFPTPDSSDQQVMQSFMEMTSFKYFPDRWSRLSFRHTLTLSGYWASGQDWQHFILNAFFPPRFSF